jgi:hypothetical protein
MCKNGSLLAVQFTFKASKCELTVPSLQHLVETQELTVSDAAELKETVESMKKNGQEIKAELIAKKVRRCGICRQPGHNRRTCPQK